MSLLYLLIMGIAVGPAGISTATEVVEADSIRKYRFLAKTKRQKKEYDTALQYYQEYLRYRPGDHKAHFFIGQIYYQKSRGHSIDPDLKQEFVEAARDALHRAVAIDSLHVNSNLLLHEIYKSDYQQDPAIGNSPPDSTIGDSPPDSAAFFLERVLAARPDDSKYRRKMADYYQQKGEVRLATSHYVRVAQNEEGNRELVKLIADLYGDLGEAEQSLVWRKRLLESPDSVGTASSEKGLHQRVNTLESIFELQRETGDVDAAFETLMQLVRIDSLNRHSYYSRMVSLAEERGDESMKLEGLKGMFRADPGDLETLAKLVEWHLNEGDRKAAWQKLDHGLRLDGDNAHLQLLKGDALASQGAEEEALAAFEIARRDPVWERIAQQRIWNLRPPETEEEKLKKAFFGGDGEDKE
jgi:tetratricopeptide (TPR) repeat protein